MYPEIFVITGRIKVLLSSIHECFQGEQQQQQPLTRKLSDKLIAEMGKLEAEVHYHHNS